MLPTDSLLSFVHFHSQKDIQMDSNVFYALKDIKN